MNEYLKNSICKFTPLFEIDYNKKKNIISCSFFKMSEGAYKNFSKYTNGLKIFYNYINKNLKNFTIRLFIEESILQDKKIMKDINKLKNLELVKFSCSSFKKNKIYHRGTFSTFVRFFPIFDFKNNDSNIVIIADIDWSSIKHIESKFKMLDNYKLIKNKKKLDLNLLINTTFHQANVKYDYTYKKIKIGYFVAYNMLNIKKINKNILIKYIKNIDNTYIKLPYTIYNNSINYNFSSKYELLQNKKSLINKSGNNKFIYGIDEDFLNNTLKKYLINNKKSIGIIINLDILNNIYYYLKNNNYKLKGDVLNIYKYFFEFIFKGTVKDYKYESIQKSYDILDKYLYDIFTSKNKIYKLNKDQKKICKRIYIFYFKIYNTKYVKYFNKKFLDIILDKSYKYFGYVNLSVITFYNNKYKNIIIKKVKLSKKTINILQNKEYKNIKLDTDNLQNIKKLPILKGYKVIKELGKGVYGIGYLIKKNKKKYVLKIQKILESEKKYNLKYKHWKEIESFKYIQKIPKQYHIFFPKLINYSVLKCNFNLNTKNSNKTKIIKKSKYCLSIIMKYEGKEIGLLIFNKNFSLIDKYSLIVQIYYINTILNNNKLYYTDYHSENIVYIKKNKKIKINNSIINTNYIYSLIDLGSIIKRDNYNYTYIITFIKKIILRLSLISKYSLRKKNFKYIDYNNFILSYLKNKIIWNNIKNIIYKYNNKWFDSIERNKKIIIENWKMTDLFIILIGLFDKKKYLNFEGYYNITLKDYLNNLIPDKDIIFIISNIDNNNNIFEYFINKINNNNNNNKLNNEINNNNKLNNNDNNNDSNNNNNKLLIKL